MYSWKVTSKEFLILTICVRLVVVSFCVITQDLTRKTKILKNFTTNLWFKWKIWHRITVFLVFVFWAHLVPSLAFFCVFVFGHLMSVFCVFCFFWAPRVRFLRFSVFFLGTSCPFLFCQFRVFNLCNCFRTSSGNRLWRPTGNHLRQRTLKHNRKSRKQKRKNQKTKKTMKKIRKIFEKRRPKDPFTMS